MRTLLSPSINRLLTGILLSTACYPGAQAQAPDAAPFATWLENLRREAALAGVSAQTLDSALNSLEHIPRVIELDRRQPEFTQTFWNYLDTRVTRQRIERGRALLEEHRGLLASVERRYGVPPRYLVAFWGLETNFGGYFGNMPAPDSLATLACDQRRSAFFTGELMAALRILDAGDIDAENMVG